jgi:hypothetical protein
MAVETKNGEKGNYWETPTLVFISFEIAAESCKFMQLKWPFGHF